MLVLPPDFEDIVDRLWALDQKIEWIITTGENDPYNVKQDLIDLQQKLKSVENRQGDLWLTLIAILGGGVFTLLSALLTRQR